jgi:TatA/E family protein of Tat protein translocase
MGLGMQEIILILVVALIIFGPRKLPELGKSLGQAMNQFRRASDEFKRTWEQEVEYEKVRKDGAAVSTASTYDSGYSADADYQYGYDGNTNSDSSSTTEAASVAEESQAEPAPVVTEKKAEPLWI